MIHALKRVLLEPRSSHKHQESGKELSFAIASRSTSTQASQECLNKFSGRHGEFEPKPFPWLDGCAMAHKFRIGESDGNKQLVRYAQLSSVAKPKVAGKFRLDPMRTLHRR